MNIKVSRDVEEGKRKNDTQSWRNKHNIDNYSCSWRWPTRQLLSSWWPACAKAPCKSVLGRFCEDAVKMLWCYTILAAEGETAGTCVCLVTNPLWGLRSLMGCMACRHLYEAKQLLSNPTADQSCSASLWLTVLKTVDWSHSIIDNSFRTKGRYFSASSVINLFTIRYCLLSPSSPKLNCPVSSFKGVPLLFLSCPSSAPILFLSCPSVPFLSLSFSCPVPLLSLSCRSPVPLLPLSCPYLVPLMSLSCSSPIPFLFLSCPSPVPLLFLSCPFSAGWLMTSMYLFPWICCQLIALYTESSNVRHGAAQPAHSTTVLHCFQFVREWTWKASNFGVRNFYAADFFATSEIGNSVEVNMC